MGRVCLESNLFPVITLEINNVPTLFIKPFTDVDVRAIVEFVRDAANLYSGAGNTILFIDTPITVGTVEAVERLNAEGFRVVFRDHHGIDGEPTNDRDARVVAATAKLKHLLRSDCTITVRRLHPACSTLVRQGEFAGAVAIIADRDPDGLTAAMKAAGVSYPELDEDAAKLDGEPQNQVTGSAISQLLAKGMAVLPSYDSSRPKEREESQQKLFSDWLQAVEGNKQARDRLETRVLAYDEAVKTAQSLARTGTEVAPGVVLVDATRKPLFDQGTLDALLESDPRYRIMVVRKSVGPIAAIHGIQYSMAVVKRHQDAINLHDLIPPQAKSDPEFGIISNVSFLLHTSEDIWNSQVLPALRVSFPVA